MAKKEYKINRNYKITISDGVEKIDHYKTTEEFVLDNPQDFKNKDELSPITVNDIIIDDEKYTMILIKKW